MPSDLFKVALPNLSFAEPFEEAFKTVVLPSLSNATRRAFGRR
jgi:hypothetical protein